MKVCFTCRHWTKKFKGFCLHLQQGVGRFHLCEGWTATAEAQAQLPADNHRKAAEAGGR